MKTPILPCFTVMAFTLLFLFGCPANLQKAKSGEIKPVDARQELEKNARAAVLNLEQNNEPQIAVPAQPVPAEAAAPAAKYTMSVSTGNMVKISSDDQIQKDLDEQHRKAREGGYDKEFHGAIEKYGGERLKEEWKKNCQNRTKDNAELNCY